MPAEWHGRRVCAMIVCHTGAAERREAALAPLRALGEPVIDMLREQPYTELQSLMDATEPKGAHYHWRSGVRRELAATSCSTELHDLFASCPMPHGQVGLLQLGGAIGDREPRRRRRRQPRRALRLRRATGTGSRATPTATATARWVRDAGERLRPFGTGATYVNFQSADEGPERLRGVLRGEPRAPARAQAPLRPGRPVPRPLE